MLYIDVEGNSVKNAIAKGIKQLKLNENDIKTEVLQKDKRGMFGIGKKQLAKVRIFYKEMNEIDGIFQEIKKIIGYIDENVVSDFEQVGERYYLKIESQMPEHFIGKRGKTQDALQIVINNLLQKYNNTFKIIVNVSDYAKKKENNFVQWVRQQISEVRRSKKAIILNPMNSYKRRILHLEVKKYSGIKSESHGIGKLKAIKISLDKNSDNGNSGNSSNFDNSVNEEHEEQKKFASRNESEITKNS